MYVEPPPLSLLSLPVVLPACLDCLTASSTVRPDCEARTRGPGKGQGSGDGLMGQSGRLLRPHLSHSLAYSGRPAMERPPQTLLLILHYGRRERVPLGGRNPWRVVGHNGWLYLARYLLRHVVLPLVPRYYRWVVPHIPCSVGLDVCMYICSRPLISFCSRGRQETQHPTVCSCLMMDTYIHTYTK